MASITSSARPLVPNIARGAVGGLLSGAVFIAVTMWFVSSLDMPAQGPLRAISTIVLGSGALDDGSANAGLGLAVHGVLSVAYGIAFGVLVSRIRHDGVIALLGAGYGAALFVVNFLVLAPLQFTPFEGANKPFELVVHVVFGSLLALAFMRPLSTDAAPASDRRSVSVGS